MLKSNNPALHHILWHMEKNAAECSWCTLHYIHPKSPLVLPSVGRSFSSFRTWTSSQYDTARSRSLLWSALTMWVLLCYWNFHFKYMFYIHTTKKDFFFRLWKRIDMEALYYKCWVNNGPVKMIEMGQC